MSTNLGTLRCRFGYNSGGGHGLIMVMPPLLSSVNLHTVHCGTRTKQCVFYFQVPLVLEQCCSRISCSRSFQNVYVHKNIASVWTGEEDSMVYPFDLKSSGREQWQAISTRWITVHGFSRRSIQEVRIMGCQRTRFGTFSICRRPDRIFNHTTRLCTILVFFAQCSVCWTLNEKFCTWTLSISVRKLTQWSHPHSWVSLNSV